MSFKRLSILAAFSVFFLYAVLIASLLYFYREGFFIRTLLSERTLFSVKLSLYTATIATAISIAVAIPSAYALSRFQFKGKRIIDTMLELPMIVSPAALGAMLLIFFNNPIGMWIQKTTVQFVFAVNGIILAQFVTTAGIATRLMKSVLDEIPTRYEEVARSLGATPAKAFITITLPLSRNGIVAAAILSWAKALGEFGASITIAGSMAMKTETIPIAIFMRLASADIEGTVALILILAVIGLGTLYVARLLKGKKSRA